MSTVYLNGEYIPKERAFVSVDDRGFLFGDGIYEVTAVYRGEMFRWERHLARMQKGLAALRIDLDPASLEEVHNELIRVNELESTPISYVYTEITRGVAKRTHKFPPVAPTPTRYLFAGEYKRPPSGSLGEWLPLRDGSRPEVGTEGYQDSSAPGQRVRCPGSCRPRCR